jgi:ADP-ribose pyrophosphatase YjhB (NUDIX family)
MTTGAGYFRFCPRCGGPLTETYVELEEHDRLVCGDCGDILYVNPKLVAGLIPVCDANVWLLRRAIEPRYGTWTFPAGYMEMGETVQDAALRETREELGMEARVDAFLGLYSRATAPTVLAVYTGTATSPPSGGLETLEFALFTIDSIPWNDLAFWNTAAALRDWINSLSIDP